MVQRRACDARHGFNESPLVVLGERIIRDWPKGAEAEQCCLAPECKAEHSAGCSHGLARWRHGRII